MLFRQSGYVTGELLLGLESCLASEDDGIDRNRQRSRRLARISETG